MFSLPWRSLFALVLCALAVPAAKAACAYSSVTISPSGVWGTDGGNSVFVLPSGGSASFTINFTTSSGCSWSASAGSFVTFSSATSGNNNSTSVTVNFNIPAGGADFRFDEIPVKVNGSTVYTIDINQNGTSCSISITPPTTVNIGPAASSGSFTINSPGGCWFGFAFPFPPVSWVSTTFNYYTINYNVQPNNTNQPRSTTLTFVQPNTVTFTINQAGQVSASCTPVGYQGTGSVEVGVPFSSVCTATGGVGPYTWSEGAPRSDIPGSSIGQIGPSIVFSGTPTGSGGTYSIPLIVTDSTNATATVHLSGTIYPALKLTSLLPIPSATVVVSYGPVSFASISGGFGGPYNWSSNGVSLPGGLSLNTATGAISGTPAANATGSYALGYSVTDGYGSVSGTYPSGSLVVNGPPTLQLSTHSVSGSGSVGSTIGLPGVNVTSSNSQVPLTFTYSSQVNSVGPNWLQVSTTANTTPASLVIGANLAGLAPGTYTGSITVTPSNASSQTIAVIVGVTGSDSLIATYSPNVNQSLQLSTVTSTTGTITVSSSNSSVAGLYFYATSAVATPPGGTWLSIPANEAGTASAQFTVSAAAGSLPIANYSGTVTIFDTAGNRVTVSVLLIVPTPLTVTCSPQQLGYQGTGTLEVGVSFSSTCQASGGLPPYNWSLGVPRSGATGGTLSAATGLSSTYSGTPTASGAYSVPIVVTDNSSQSSKVTFVGTVDPALQITSLLPIPTAVAGFSYSPVSFANVTGGRGAGTYAWSDGSINLPLGLFMDQSTGAIQGTPIVGTNGSYALGYSVTDGLGTISGSFPFGSLVILPPPTLGASTNSSQNTGSPGLANLNVTPTPISLTSSNQAPITYTVTVQTTNALGDNWLTVNTSSLTTTQLNPATLTASANLVGLAVGTYTKLVTVTPTSLHSGGAQVIQLTAIVSGNDPLNISLNPAVGQNLQVTSATPTSGSITVTASSTLFFNTASSMTTQPGANWLSINPNAATPCTGVQQSTNTAITVSFTPGSLPPGSYDGVVTICDSLSNQKPVPVRLVVPYPPLNITGPPTLPGGTVGSAYPNTPIAAMGGNNSYTWSAPGLPSGLNIDTSTGLISGTPRGVQRQRDNLGDG